VRRIPRLEEISIGYRAAIAAVVVGLIILLLWATGGASQGPQGGPQLASQSAVPLILPGTVYDRKILELETEAIEAAFKVQIEHLFQTWMKDESGQPGRAITGARQARKAFIGAMTEIDKAREKLNVNPSPN
jgi:hypothetical protein